MRAIAYAEFLITVLIFLFIFWNVLSKVMELSSFVENEYKTLSEFFITYRKFDCEFNYPFIINPGNSIIRANCVNLYKNGSFFCILNNESRSIDISFLIENKSGIHYYSIVLEPSEKYCIPYDFSAVYLSRILAEKICVGNKEFYIRKEYSYSFIDFNKYPIICFIPFPYKT